VRIFQLIVLMMFFLSMAVYANDPEIKIKTNLGNITLELYPDKAPKTVENFLQYVADDFYKNTIFHRVIPNFMIQGGGFDPTYTQKPARQPIKNEAANGLKNQIGTIAMARTSDPHSATAQFFINVADNAFLDYSAPTERGFGYTVFGKVIDGMEVVNQIASTPTGSGGPFRSDVPHNMILIENIEVVSTVPTDPKDPQ
jgi:cyclophilin family peptidyl-prolyl cis-trans isomerase